MLDLPAGARQDPTFRRTGGVEIGRDGTRVPIPWSGDEPPYGFGPAGSVPWLPQPTVWAELSVEAETADEGSTLSMYREALRIRRSHPGLTGTALGWLEAPAGVLRFARGHGFECVVNASRAALDLPPGARVLLASASVTGGRLPADAAAWIELPLQALR